MSLRRAPSLTTLVSKGRRIAQLSRQVEELQQQLKNAEVEMDELMNAESPRLQSLEKDKTQMFKDKNEAELKAAKLQRQFTNSQTQLKTLQRTATEVIEDKVKVEAKAEMLSARVVELEAKLRETQEGTTMDVASFRSKPHEEGERSASGDQPEGTNVEAAQEDMGALSMQSEAFEQGLRVSGSDATFPNASNVTESQKGSTSSSDHEYAGVCPHDQPLTLGNSKKMITLASE
ncbi:hypothetical protein EV360DRAFT_69587, partial [Lentinula raphanica]